MSTYEKYRKEGREALKTSIIAVPLCIVLTLLLLISPAALGGIVHDSIIEAAANPAPKEFEFDKIPEWNGKKSSVKVHGNKPYFSKRMLKNRRDYAVYGRLDRLKRCSNATACIGSDMMPDKPRGYIGMVKPTGWHIVKYAGIDGNNLYNRCHLIGYQLTGENANKKNLITGTRYLNIDGMLTYENLVADYLRKNRKNHVLYRVTPVFKGKDLLARGVLMEAQSIEDNGRGVRFCVFCYNAQPGIKIDYRTGDSKGAEYTGKVSSKSSDTDSKLKTYILNTNSRRFHLPSCESVKDMSAKNKKTVKTSRDKLIKEGYKACGSCRP